jgi:hypothetical protein
VNGIHEVSGSIPLGSTIQKRSKIKNFWRHSPQALSS